MSGEIYIVISCTVYYWSSIAILGSSELKMKIEENCKCMKFNTEIVDLQSVKLHVKWRKALYQGTLSGGSTVCFYSVCTWRYLFSGKRNLHYIAKW